MTGGIAGDLLQMVQPLAVLQRPTGDGLEVEAGGGVVVGRHRLGVAVHHQGLEALLPVGMQGEKGAAREGLERNLAEVALHHLWPPSWLNQAKAVRLYVAAVWQNAEGRMLKSVTLCRSDRHPLWALLVLCTPCLPPHLSEKEAWQQQ